MVPHLPHAFQKPTARAVPGTITCERFDGSGYPDGLRGAKIPLLARIISICDAFDALINDRPYRAGVSVDSAIATLRTGSGTQWDPELVDLFIAELPVIEHMGAA